jgi:hyperosmotically inducible periplasmic protein
MRIIGIVLSSVLLALLVTLNACQSTSKKVAGMAINDASISTAVQTRLTSDRLANFAHVAVDTERGIVNLRGIVETEEERARAERLAHQVEGVVRG